MVKKKSSKQTSNSLSLQKTKTGKFTKEESDKLLKAVNNYISKNFECSRENALRLMISKRGNIPSILTLLGREVLPNRQSRSIYNYFRRHLMSHKSGKWSDSELLLLLKNFFENDKFEGNCWKSVAKQINRSPEQIHDKFRELKPYINRYKPVVMDANLSNDEKLTQLNSLTKSLRTKTSKKNEKFKEFMNSRMQQEFYDTVRELMRKNRKDGHVENIPWVKVQEKFSNYPVSKLRIHFNMTLLPKVYRKVYPGFSVNMVSRLSIRWIRKLLKRANSGKIQSINDLDFRVKFPQIPVIYMRHCTRRSLTKLVRRYANQVMKPQKYLLDADFSEKEIDDLKNVADNSLRGLFTNKNFHRIIKFAYRDMEVKKWKREDRHILKMINNDILPECKL